MIQIQTFTFNDFQENTYLLFDDTKECIIVDPGCYDNQEQEKLSNFVTENKLKPVLLINTHCHIDHVLGNRFVSDKWMLDLAMHYCTIYGFHNYQESPLPNHFLNEGEKVKFGESELDILFTPGHAPGHIVLHSEKHDFIIGGDVLFQMSIGRTDLPGGDFDILIKSIKEKLLPIDDNTKVYCGHGPTTTIGFEKANNPF